MDATFSGVEEFLLFWERFSLNRDINVANGYWTTDAEQAQQFARLLKGDAFKHYVSLPSTIKQDINGLYDVFKTKYDAPSSEYTYRQQLHDLKRISSELLSEFAYRVENLVNKAYSHSDEKNIRLIDAFVAGVDQKLAKKYYEAEGNNPDGSSMTLRELIAFFERFERIWNIPHESNESQACGTQSASTLPSQMAEITHQISALQAQVGRLSNIEAGATAVEEEMSSSRRIGSDLHDKESVFIAIPLAIFVVIVQFAFVKTPRGNHNKDNIVVTNHDNGRTTHHSKGLTTIVHMYGEHHNSTRSRFKLVRPGGGGGSPGTTLRPINMFQQ